LLITSFFWRWEDASVVPWSALCIVDHVHSCLIQEANLWLSGCSFNTELGIAALSLQVLNPGNNF
jgi:hypothetical protein